MDVPSKMQIFIPLIGFLLANLVLYAICRTSGRPKNTCAGNVKIMRGGAGSRSILIDNLRGRRILGHRKWSRVGPISDKTSQIAIGLPSGATRPLPGRIQPESWLQSVGAGLGRACRAIGVAVNSLGLAKYGYHDNCR